MAIQITSWFLSACVLFVLYGSGTAQGLQQDDVANRNALTDAKRLTEVIDRLQSLEEKLLKQGSEIVHLKEKHRVDLEDVRTEYENKIAALKTQREGDATVIHKMIGEIRHLQKLTKTDGSDTGTFPEKQRRRRDENDINVSFFAKIVQNVHHLGQNQNVIFDTVVTNNGNAYNHYVGAFIAPVDGTYLFSTTLVTFNTDTSHYGIFVNDNQTTILYVNGADNPSDSASQTVVLQLREQDTVSVRHLDTDKALVGYHHSLFSGVLIAQEFFGSTSIIGK